MGETNHMSHVYTRVIEAHTKHPQNVKGGTCRPHHSWLCLHLAFIQAVQGTGRDQLYRDDLGHSKQPEKGTIQRHLRVSSN